MKKFGIIEIGSSNTKTHIYENGKVIYEDNTTIEFKKNYKNNNKIILEDLEILYKIIERALEYTLNINIYGCSIFRNITKDEFDKINDIIYNKFNLKIELVSQEDEAYYTALGCYSNIDYRDNMCIFIGGGGSVELIFVKNKKIVDKKYYDFGVVDVTNQYESLKSDIPDVTFDEVYNYVDNLMGDIDIMADVLVLAGGDHFYWYNNAKYKLFENDLYDSVDQEYMLPVDVSDKYDRDCFFKSLGEIKNNSDNPKWFDGARAMKVVTNVVSHKINAKYIIPTKINMENGLKNKIMNE